MSVNRPTASSAEYTNDHVTPSNDGPIQEYLFVGDTSGDDLVKTGFKSTKFNTVGLHIRETGNCVTKTEAKSLMAGKAITPALVQHLQEALKQ